MSAETWRPVEGWPYEVSDLGRVRRSGSARALNPTVTSHGYLVVNLRADGRARLAYVHSLVAEAFLGPRPSSHEVNHKDGQRQHNALANLEYVTHRENMQHAARLGLWVNPVPRVKRGEGPRQVRSNIADITGQSVGHLTVIAPGRLHRFACGAPRRFWLVRCVCGHESEVDGQPLRRGKAPRCPACTRMARGTVPPVTVNPARAA